LDVIPKKTDVDNTKHLPQRNGSIAKLSPTHTLSEPPQPLYKGAKIGKSNCLNVSEY